MTGKKEKHRDKHSGGSKQHSPGLVSRTIQTEFHSQGTLRARSPSHVPVKGGGKGQSFFKSPEKVSEIRGEKSKSPKKKHSPNKDKSVDDSDDEMSEKKRKLLSRVLAPAKKSRHPSSGYDEEERKLTIDIEEEMLRKIRKKEKKMKKREKKRRLLEERLKESENNIKHEEAEAESDHGFAPCDQYIEDMSENEEDANTEQQNQNNSNTSQDKSEDIRTVDLSQLGDLFQDYQNTGANISQSQVFAKKSIPATSQQQQQQLLLQQQQQQQQLHHQQQLQHHQQQQQQQQVYILPDPGPGVTSITLHPGQDIPIIDCRSVLLFHNY